MEQFDHERVVGILEQQILPNLGWLQIDVMQTQKHHGVIRLVLFIIFNHDPLEHIVHGSLADFYADVGRDRLSDNEAELRKQPSIEIVLVGCDEEPLQVAD